MILRSVALSLSALVLCAADYPPPPAQLEPYVKDGRFDPGDYGWMKGRFGDATPEERQTHAAINDWAGACREAARAELGLALREAGYTEAIDRAPVPMLRCLNFAQPQLPDDTSFATFQQELAAARPVVEAYLVAVELAEQSSRPAGRSPDLARMLETRPVGEQMIRRALFWGQGMPAGTPMLSQTGRAIVQSRLGAAMTARDHANTEWLKGIVAEHGWPTISQVGEEAAFNAWLLVQHADHDPLFQFQALRLMEPLVAQGEVTKQNYAYLYDRIMLKLSGKQRYATQVMCRDGERQPQPLEDEANVERLRSEMGLPTVAEYLAVFTTTCEGPPGTPR